eukprot:Clim_evm3s43 gene=Clim_evmTU3s43
MTNNAGSDTQGTQYQTWDDMWQVELAKKAADGNLEWYEKAKEYWENEPETVNGMLGGFGKLSSLDINASRSLIRRLIDEGVIDAGYAVDCGAGIGRIARKLLIPIFQSVDLVELVQKFVDKARSYVGDDRLKETYCCGLQDFNPEEGKYNLIWVQWVIGYLHDDDFVAFLNRCAKGLVPGKGCVIIKDNVITDGGFIVDKDDSSVTRDETHLLKLVEKSDLKLIREEDQEGFPNGMFPVKSYVLMP